MTAQREAHNKNKPADYRRAQQLRKESSWAEQKLWWALRSLSKEAGLAFRRQHPLRPYIVDFVCLKIKLVVELDGASHDNRQRYDGRRTAYLQNLGYTVVRFSNEAIMANPEGVAMAIIKMAGNIRPTAYTKKDEDSARSDPPPNLPRKGGGFPARLAGKTILSKQRPVHSRKGA